MQFLNTELFLWLVCDEFDRVFIDNDQDLQYKKLNWFWSLKSFLYSGEQWQKSQAKSFFNAGSYCMFKIW